MEERPPSPMTKLYNFLPTIEMICLAGVLLGLLLKRFEQPSDQVFKISLVGLAIVYYLSAFRPPEKNPGETPSGFTQLLFATILPKVLGISLSVAVIGVLFSLLQMKGSREMLLIGCSILAMSLLLMGVGLAMGNERAKFLTPLLYRAIPVLLISTYYLYL